jgi:beta-glucosidase
MQGFSTLQWPGVPSKEFKGHLECHYSEKQITGYRWYDQNNVAPAFPFGFGEWVPSAVVDAALFKY